MTTAFGKLGSPMPEPCRAGQAELPDRPCLDTGADAVAADVVGEGAVRVVQHRGAALDDVRHFRPDLKLDGYVVVGGPVNAAGPG